MLQCPNRHIAIRRIVERLAHARKLVCAFASQFQREFFQSCLIDVTHIQTFTA